jgi:hypothetical protein
MQHSLVRLPTGCVKVPAGFNTTNRIPGNYVTQALRNVEVAIWADPGFIFFGICANAGLNCVFNAALEFDVAHSHSHQREVEFFWFSPLRLSAFWAIWASHLVPADFV